MSLMTATPKGLTASSNSGYAVRYRSPKPLRASHTRETLSEIAAEGELWSSKTSFVRNATSVIISFAFSATRKKMGAKIAVWAGFCL